MKLSLILAAATWAQQAAPQAERFSPPIKRDWMRIYSSAPFKEIWSANLSVKDIKKGAPEVLAVAQKVGAALTGPLESFPRSEAGRTQQLSFSMPAKMASTLSRDLSKLGAMGAPIVRPTGEPVPLAEVKDK